jgi:opacity protein-like surface antigen
MMSISLKFFTATLVLATTTSTAIAGDFYGALDVGQTSAHGICSVLPGNMSGCTNTASLMRVAGGYQFTPRFGTEISYGSYGTAKLAAGSSTSADWKMSGLQLSGTITDPIAAGFSSIIKVGFASTELELSGSALNAGSYKTTKTQFTWGLGVKYDFSQQIAVRAQYDELGNVGDNNTGTYKTTQLSVGVVYKF